MSNEQTPPPTDAVLRTHDGLLWEFYATRQRWGTFGLAGIEYFTWDQLIECYGKVDVLVWRGAISAAERNN